MPKLGPQRRKTDPPGPATVHRCSMCQHVLHLVRRHESPARLGPIVAVEFYECSACDSGYALNLTTGKWRRWAGDDD